MDDESGWNMILVEGWGPLVRAAVVDRVVRSFAGRRGLLVATVLDPDDADAEWVEDVHTAVVAAIAAETGADIEELGSQAAWATYDEVWAALAETARDDRALVPIPEHRLGQALALLAELPADAADHAGGVRVGDQPALPVLIEGRARVHIDGVFRWLATERDAAESHRALARALIAVVRDDPLGDVTPPA